MIFVGSSGSMGDRSICKLTKINKVICQKMLQRDQNSNPGITDSTTA